MTVPLQWSVIQLKRNPFRNFQWVQNTILTSQFLANTACINAALWHKTNLKCIELLEAGDFIVSVTHCVYCAEKNPTPGIERLNQPGFPLRTFANQTPIQPTMLLLTLLKFIMTYFSCCNRRRCFQNYLHYLWTLIRPWTLWIIKFLSSDFFWKAHSGLPVCTGMAGSGTLVTRSGSILFYSVLSSLT